MPDYLVALVVNQTCGLPLTPAFSMVGSDGKTYDSASLRGRFVVLAWFPKANTSG